MFGEDPFPVTKEEYLQYIAYNDYNSAYETLRGQQQSINLHFKNWSVASNYQYSDFFGRRFVFTFWTISQRRLRFMRITIPVVDNHSCKKTASNEGAARVSSL